MAEMTELKLCRQACIARVPAPVIPAHPAFVLYVAVHFGSSVNTTLTKKNS